MGYVLRVRIASFFAGVAVSSLAGIYTLHRDYEMAHETLTHQANGLYQSLEIYQSQERRISALETLQEVEASKHIDAAP